MSQKLQFFQRPHHHLKVGSVFIWRSNIAMKNIVDPWGLKILVIFIILLYYYIAYKILVIAAQIDVTRSIHK